MVIKKVNLDIVIGVTSAIPDTEFPEVAFAGKSNVGKSSLINALMNRKSYARTSSQPGKTQTINFYNINDAMYLVDLPGSENDKMMYNWIVDNGFRPVIIATKLDKLKRSQIAKHVKAVRAGLGLKEDDILIPFSSQTKQGLDELWNTIEGYIGQ